MCALQRKAADRMRSDAKDVAACLQGFPPSAALH
jgi:hypothetical protein